MIEAHRFENAGPELTGPVSGNEYMDVLLARQKAWMDAHPARDDVRLNHLPHLVPLLEWFIRAGDEQYVMLEGK